MRAFLEKHPDWKRPVTSTTRPIRSGEQDGVDYNFLGRGEFENKIKRGDFLEWVEYTGNLYGTPRQTIEELLEAGANMVLRVDIQGALHIKDQIPKAVAIYLLPAKFEELEQRFRDRGTDSEELTEARLKLAKEELSYKDRFDYIVINPAGHPEKAVTDVERILEL